MLSTQGCWECYGTLLAREYEDPALFRAAHRWTVDAYALQHPGAPDDRRAFRSVRLHYASLHLIFQYGRSQEEATAALRLFAKQELPPLPTAPSGFDVTLASVRDASRLEHVVRVEEWARCAYASWHELEAQTDEMIRRIEARSGI